MTSTQRMESTASKNSLTEKEYDARIKNAFMWNLGRSQEKSN
jgi:hypothetical protein